MYLYLIKFILKFAVFFLGTKQYKLKVSKKKYMMRGFKMRFHTNERRMPKLIIMLSN